MKKIFLCAAVMSLFLGACSDGKRCQTSDSNDEIYTGLLPAADAEGVRYTLKLDYDNAKSDSEGSYDLVEVYVESDSTSASGSRDAARFKSEGDFTVIQGQGADSGKRYLKLVQDVKDSSAGSNGGPIFFYVESDSTLVMVNSELQPSEMPGLNYTLRLVK